ncbi:hypothetical protein FOZ61_003958 [Perkinsus olseni]|uniref:Uncharacterized protein n=1 Tax=Perkinsus olseni TaxID=32597 RepID=A0A7J6LMK1_PEROL|nr:hypothetical protein FOZ61_003958 [Perkinsus olseni]
MAVMRERLESSLRDKEMMRERMRLQEEELALCKVKKRSYRADAHRLKEDVETLRARAACLGEETSSNMEEVKYWQKTAEEANRHINEMSKSFTHEVRLLQRALECARGGGKQQFKLTESADLVERLGRAVLQRDDAYRDKIRLGAKVREFRQQLMALQSERNSLALKLNSTTRQIDTLKESNRLLMNGSMLQEGTVVVVKDGDRIGQKKAWGRVEDVALGTASAVEAGTVVLDDDDFEVELRAFEQRYMMLGEGSEGAEQLTTKLHAECKMLRRDVARCKEEAESLRADLTQWRDLAEDRLAEVLDLEAKVTSLNETVEEQKGQLEAAAAAAVVGEGERGAEQKELAEGGLRKRDSVEVRETRELAKSLTRSVTDKWLRQGEEEEECTSLYRGVQEINTGETVEVSVVERRVEGGEGSSSYEVMATVDGSRTYTITVDPQYYQDCPPEDKSWISEVVTLLGLIDDGEGGSKRLVVPEPAGSAELEGGVSVTVYQYTPTVFYVTAYDGDSGAVGATTLDVAAEATDTSSLSSCDAAQWVLSHLELSREADQNTIHLALSHAPPVVGEPTPPAAAAVD